MADRLLVDLDPGGLVTVGVAPDGGLYEQVSRARLEWPLDGGALEDLRWYLEDYLRAPFGVWEDRGPRVQARLAAWGEAVFGSVFGIGPARDAYQRARDHGLELVFRSGAPGPLGLPWELMRDPGGPVALNLAGVSRALPVADLAQAAVPGGRLRVLMVISRPAGTGDIGYRMVARPLLERLAAVRGEVDLVVLRPPTLESLHDTLAAAVAAGEPFQVVHFDGHGALPDRRGGGPGRGGRPATLAGPAGEGVLAFEKPGGGADEVPASKVAAVLHNASVPVVVLNACQSGAVGKDLEAAVATRLLREGCAAVVAMAYSVYAVAAAEFMATFYERLFAGDTVSAAVTAGRRRLFHHDLRPSPKGDLPLADWLVPVHYLRRDVSFPQARASRPAGGPSLDAVLDELRAPGPDQASGKRDLDPVGVFVGRDDLFYQLEAAARLQKVVVLHGQGGTGKTELAKAFGRWWRDTGGVEKQEWALWHSFEPGVASFGLDGVITEAGLAVFGSDFARLGPAERRWVVERLLEQRRLLLIWDNFETVRSMPDPAAATPPLDEAACHEIKGFLARLAAGGKSAVIITSRTAEDWLGPVRRIGVGGLTPEEAAEYATELLAPYPAAARRRERRAFGELLEWLDGHPLSMRLILPRLDSADPEALLEALRGAAPLPDTGDDPGGDRTTSLAASISYSFTYLAEKTTRLLPAVCLFHGVADAAVLALFSGKSGVPARFAGASGQDWTDVLEDGARVGLLTSLGAGMYQVHPALPSYLAAQWRSEDPSGYDRARDAAIRALAAAYATVGDYLMMEIVSGHAGVAFTVIALHHRTLGALLGYALDHRLWEQAQAIAQPLSSYWEVRGLDEEAAAWADRIVIAAAKPDGSPPPLDSPAGRLWLFITGQEATRQQRAMRLDDAERSYRQILGMLQEQPVSPERQSQLAITYHELGTVAWGRGQLGEASDWYRKALAMEEELGDLSMVGTTYHQLGMAAQGLGRLDEAEGCYRKSLAIEEELGNRRGMARTYHQLGILAQQRGQLGDAADWSRKALAIQASLGDRPGMAGSHQLLGFLAQARGRLDEAEEWYRETLATQEDLGDRRGAASTYHQLGWLAQDRGRLDEAEEWYRGSLAIKEQLGDRPGAAPTYHQLGRLAQDRRRLDEAGDWYHKALAIYAQLGDRPGAASVYHQLGILAQDRGQLSEAGEWFRQSLAIKEELGDRPGMASGYHELGNIAYRQGRLADAESCYRKALAIDEELGSRPAMALTFAQLGLLAEHRGEPHQALEWMVRCTALSGEFPHPLAGPGPEHLERLAAQLGMPALEECWRKVTGGSLPAAVRAYVTASPAGARDQQPR